MHAQPLKPLNKLSERFPAPTEDLRPRRTANYPYWPPVVGKFPGHIGSHTSPAPVAVQRRDELRARLHALIDLRIHAPNSNSLAAEAYRVGGIHKRPRRCDAARIGGGRPSGFQALQNITHSFFLPARLRYRSSSSPAQLMTTPQTTRKISSAQGAIQADIVPPMQWRPQPGPGGTIP